MIQLKLANMEVARLNVENLVFRTLERAQAGKPMSLAEASSLKLYAAQAAMSVTLEAVQLFGGNGYMAEYEVEQLCRDAKVLQIYAGTDEIQVGHIARAPRVSTTCRSSRLPAVGSCPIRAMPTSRASSASAPISSRPRCSRRIAPGCSRCGSAGAAPIAWWSPDPRGIVPLDGFHASRSLRRVRRRFDVTFDTAFADVVAGCADPARPHGWIDESFAAAYTRLHELGWAHSVEVWHDGELAGGVYGVRIGGLFAGESMFHAADASKVALWALVDGAPPRRRLALRRAVDDPAPELARRDRHRALGVPAAVADRRRPTSVASPEWSRWSCTTTRVAASRGRARHPPRAGVDVEVVEYLHQPPDRAALERILDAISDPPEALVRKDKRFKELGLDASGYTTRRPSSTCCWSTPSSWSARSCSAASAP